MKKWSLVLWKKIISLKNEGDIILVTNILRRIWLRRIVMIFENKFEHPKSLIRGAKQSVEDYNSAQKLTSSIPSNEGSRSHRASTVWSKPKREMVKANDAATNAENGRVGIGVIVRDSMGESLACLCSTESLFTSPPVAKTTALRRAMLFCIELGLKDVLLEGDSQVIIRATKSKRVLYIDYSCIVEDMKKIFSENSTWQINFIQREVSTIVDTFLVDRIWMEDGPIQIYNSVSY